MVSIIVLTYNRINLLTKTINSILKQTYPDFEIIIVNDGSNDNTDNLKTIFPDKKVKLFNLSKQNNLAKLRNYGVQKAAGEYIAFCDDDDLWIETKLEIQIQLLKNFDFVCSNAKLIDIDDNIVSEKYLNIETSILDTKSLLLNNSIMPSSVVFNKKILNDNKPFDEFNYINLCEDYNLWIKLSSITQLYFLNEELIYHRTHNSWARSFNNSRQIYLNHLSLLKPFTKSENVEIRDAAYLSILNNKIYELKNFFNNKKYLSVFNKSVGLMFLILKPEYFKSFYVKVQSYLNKKKNYQEN